MYSVHFLTHFGYGHSNLDLFYFYIPSYSLKRNSQGFCNSILIARIMEADHKIISGEFHNQ